MRETSIEKQAEFIHSSASGELIELSPKSALLYTPNSVSARVERLQNDYLQLRYEFAEFFDWPSKGTGTDIDRYDKNENTAYVVVETQDSEFGQPVLDCGMRLTPIVELEESLSYEMLAYNDKLAHSIP
ncbi:MAG: hypothetical protein LC687_08150, partial [Actinobacteria bacterium]|nr:hypothetical protein [Actinomycetota bacterium]